MARNTNSWKDSTSGSLVLAKMEIQEKMVQQLNGSNYQRWKFELEAILEAREVLDVVSGEVVLPKDEATEWSTS